MSCTAEQEKEEKEVEFFDPDLDEHDENWVVQQRQGRQTDAILSCPSCFTTCCIDCQQHEYKDQYRAMFVTNCRCIPLPARHRHSESQGQRLLMLSAEDRFKDGDKTDCLGLQACLKRLWVCRLLAPEIGLCRYSISEVWILIAQSSSCSSFCMALQSGL